MAKAKTASDTSTPPLAAPAAPPAQRLQGGSYTVQPDGTAQRVEHTRDAEPGTDNTAAADAPASQE